MPVVVGVKRGMETITNIFSKVYRQVHYVDHLDDVHVLLDELHPAEPVAQ